MLFVGDDWAEDPHDVEVVDDQGSVLARRRLPEGFDGFAALHALIATHLPEGWADLEPGQAQALVKVGIETDRGPWVAALVVSGHEPGSQAGHPYARASHTRPRAPTG